MKHLIRLGAVLALLLLLALPALAQSGSFVFHDTTGQLNRSQIQQAAQPLVRQGAKVAVYMVGSGGGADDFTERLTSDGLLRSGLTDSNAVAIYVSTNPRYSAIRYGDNWNQALGTNNNYDTIRNNILNPGLSSGDFTKAFVNTLGAVANAITHPPQAGGGTTVNVNLVPVVVGAVGVAGVVGGGSLLLRRRRAQQTLADARGRFTEAKQAAGAAIADMGRALNDARDKAQFDKVSYGPADVQQLSVIQNTVEQNFAQAQVQFDDTGEAFERKANPTIADYDTGAEAYKQVQQHVAELRTQLGQAEELRRELDGLARQAPAEIDRAKKA